MNKTPNEICKAILERRNRMTHVILPGEIMAVIGPEGVSEALRQRWLVPDTDSGYLCATNDLAKVAEMQRIAEMKPEQFSGQELPVAESHGLSLLHTRRSHTINEIAAPMTGGGSPGLSSIGEPSQQTSQPQSTGSTGSPQVGTNVTVARQGVKATGVIEKLMPDGRYQVGYGQDVRQKPPGDNIFGKDEMTVVPSTPQQQQAQAPATA